MHIVIDAVIAGKIGFASHQNAVPVLRELRITHGGDTALSNLTVELASDPPFLEPKTWRIDHLAPQDALHITERDVNLHAGYLGDLTESLAGHVTLRVMHDGQALATRSLPIEILARNEWGGAGAMPELLPAFALPNDPAIDHLLKAASEVLRQAGRKDAIDGYTGHSRTRPWELASALWSAVAGLGLSYALPPASFERQGQKVRTPGTILDARVATCLDSALLFAAALEQAGLNPLLILTRGHAFVGLWLQPQEFSQLITDDAAAVRKRIDLKEILVFETTLATQAPVPGFSEAVAVAQRQLTDEDFVMAVDVHRARMQRIRPMAVSTAAGSAEPAPESAGAALTLEAAPALPDFDVELPAHDSTPAGKLALWQRKLLDLTTRNRLLHLPDNARGVRLLCPEPAALEDRLADGKRIRIVALPDLEAGGRDSALYEAQTRENLQDTYARAALERGEVLVAQDKERLQNALIDLYRKARSDLDEGGANTLFLAVGFLKWKKTAHDPRTYSAPLILLPVKLERKSALSGVTMTLSEDEPRFNLTLLELLRHDFDLIIPGLDGDLPGDGTGVDVEAVWNLVRRAVRDIPGFEVSNEVVLGTFSFAKYLMWKDLADRVDQLRESPLVRHLLERTPESAYTGAGHFPAPETLDATIDPAHVFAPLPADSSQLAAVIASASGGDFVLDGPPGTGKSQTIANMIAHNLALGRRVLFVAEKMAALDVVHRRLEAQGLGAFCLELHSSKASKMGVLKQLERAWDTRESLSPDEWAQEAAQVQRLRDKLNAVVAVLHRRWPNGLTVHEAMGRVVRDASEHTPRLSWPQPTAHDAGMLAQLRDVVRRLDMNRRAGRELGDGFGLIAATDWTNGWQAAIVQAAAAVPPALDALAQARDALLHATQLPLAADDDSSIAALLSLTELLLQAHGVDLRFAFAPDAAARREAAGRALTVLEDYTATVGKLSVPYAPEAARRINVEALEAAWTQASGKFWFLATLATKKVAQQLAAEGGTSGLPDVPADLPLLRQLRTQLAELDTLAPALTGLPGWALLATDTARLASALALGHAVQTALSAHAHTPQQLVALRAAVVSLVGDGNTLLAAPGPVATARDALLAACAAHRDTATALLTLASQPTEPSVPWDALRHLSAAIAQQPTQLKPWCDWGRVRNEADALGLQALTQALASGALSDADAAAVFETAYARWFAAGIIDAEPLLRHFVSAEHMSDIAAYRALDDRLSQLSVRYIRATLCARIPAKNDIGRHGGYAVLRHELQKSRRHKPVRQLAQEMGESLTQLAPCMLMSPLSIAQYLPPGQALFDLVIFDEASQIAPWDAIGSIARGKQVVIAGDPRQMPPTAFFNRAANAADDDTEEDMESILDECLGAGIPSHSLSWHYRSRHESLIAFSNHRYYDSSLITFPAAVTRQSAVAWRRVPGVYAKGLGRNNPLEAQALVDETVARLTDPAFVAAGHSIGIITLNSEQQKLVQDLLDQARQRHPEIEPFFAEDHAEPVVVKNLETVQGDERDLILLGIGYGPTEAGAQAMSMNFGPLNREGGWRRLNVAVTRARRDMIVFSSFDPFMVDLNRTNARAVRDLKHFIEFAQRGPRALAQASQGASRQQAPFEDAVAEGLRARGWHVVPQIGVSRFRIDLGIVHPDRPDDYLVGVECDGATYQAAATARDRDKVRSAVLGGLGWTLLRVWSTDWWVDKDSALTQLHAAIDAVLYRSRAAAQAAALEAETRAAALANAPQAGEDAVAVPPEVEPQVLTTEPLPAAPETLHPQPSDDQAPLVDAPLIADTEGQTTDASVQATASAGADEARAVAADDAVGVQPRLASAVSLTDTPEALSATAQDPQDAALALAPGSAAPAIVRMRYRQADLSAFAATLDPAQFHEPAYEPTLAALVTHIVTHEAPMLDMALVQRVARVHGFQRSGRLIRERVLALALRQHHGREDAVGGQFIWTDAAQADTWRAYRVPEGDDPVRAMEDIATEEIRCAAHDVAAAQQVQEVARRFGLKRLAGAARTRLDAALATAMQD